MTTLNGRQLLELALAHEDVDHMDPATWGPILRYVTDEGLTLAHFDVLAARAVPLAVFAVALVAGHRAGHWTPAHACYPALVAARLTERTEGGAP